MKKDILTELEARIDYAERNHLNVQILPAWLAILVAEVRAKSELKSGAAVEGGSV